MSISHDQADLSIDVETVQQALVRGRRERAKAVRSLFSGRLVDDASNGASAAAMTDRARD